MALQDFLGMEFEFQQQVINVLDPFILNLVDQPQKINRETLVANKLLVNADPTYQHLIVNTPGLEVFLPVVPVTHTRFKIVNAFTSTEGFTIDTIVLQPGEGYHIMYDGVEWVGLP